MQSHSTVRPRSLLQRGVITGSAASLLSTLMIVRRSRRDSGDPYCGTNATSHWLWGEPALHQHGASARYTLLGYLIHHICSVFWGCFYEAWLNRLPGCGAPARWRETTSKAATVAALAATVDYTATPRRLTPGFERHLSLRSMGWVYAAFGIGLACTTCCLAKRQ